MEGRGGVKAPSEGISIALESDLVGNNEHSLQASEGRTFANGVEKDLVRFANA
jgi:hypothetical protein